ncbi:probable proline--tRNA ligase, mitochondrial isoform X2 [Engraulis encrasicolus]
MLQTGLLHPSNPGCFYYLPATVRSMEKLVRLIDQEMQAIGGQKLDMPALCAADLWRRSGRWDLMGKELLRLKDRHGIDYCLGPTHEEAVTELLASQANLSYRQLPLLLYQVTRKFRDEQKPKFGLLRGREFYMKDMYSFDVSEEAAHHTYQSVCQAYGRLFDRLGLRWVQVRADTGNIGGTLSHEFQLPADVGEDRLLTCGACSFSANVELVEEGRTDCPQCKSAGTLVESKGIEVGHTFYLGTKYSRVFQATFNTAQNKAALAEMGCFGLGVTRILAASIEVLSGDEGIRWPGLVAPYQVCVLPPKRSGKTTELINLAEGLAHQLASLPGLRGEVVLDDRTQMTIGKRLKDASQLGYPYVVVVGQGAAAAAEQQQFEVICQRAGETLFLTRDALTDLLSQVETV